MIKYIIQLYSFFRWQLMMSIRGYSFHSKNIHNLITTWGSWSIAFNLPFYISQIWAFVRKLRGCQVADATLHLWWSQRDSTGGHSWRVQRRIAVSKFSVPMISDWIWISMALETDAPHHRLIKEQPMYSRNIKDFLWKKYGCEWKQNLQGKFSQNTILSSIPYFGDIISFF